MLVALLVGAGVGLLLWAAWRWHKGKLDYAEWRRSVDALQSQYYRDFEPDYKGARERADKDLARLDTYMAEWEDDV